MANLQYFLHFNAGFQIPKKSWANENGVRKSVDYLFFLPGVAKGMSTLEWTESSHDENVGVDRLGMRVANESAYSKLIDSNPGHENAINY